MDTKDPLLNLANSSGFIFQIGLRREIEKTRDQHNWNFIDWEIRWKHPNIDAAGFIDLEIEHSWNPNTMVIECKRAKNSDWVFLFPKGYSKRSKKLSAFWTFSGKPTGDYAWLDCEADPESAECAFCVVKGQGDARPPMLERVTDDLIPATEASAFNHLQPWVMEDMPEHHFFFPVVVTNALLHICSFDPNDVEMKNGELLMGKGEFASVEMVRFRKMLASPSEPSERIKANNWKQAKEQTVLVINANSLPNVLKQFQLAPGTGDYMASYFRGVG